MDNRLHSHCRIGCSWICFLGCDSELWGIVSADLQFKPSSILRLWLVELIRIICMQYLQFNQKSILYVWTSFMINSVKRLTPQLSCWLPAEAVVVFMRLLCTLNSLALVVVTNPSFREIRMGGASFPWNHSSASAEGSGPMVSGYRSSWNRSDCTEREEWSKAETWHVADKYTWVTFYLAWHSHDYGLAFPLMELVEPGGGNIIYCYIT